jgi:hypothetical protein
MYYFYKLIKDYLLIITSTNTVCIRNFVTVDVFVLLYNGYRVFPGGKAAGALC